MCHWALGVNITAYSSLSSGNVVFFFNIIYFCFKIFPFISLIYLFWKYLNNVGICKIKKNENLLDLFPRCPLSSLDRTTERMLSHTFVNVIYVIYICNIHLKININFNHTIYLSVYWSLPLFCPFLFYLIMCLGDSQILKHTELFLILLNLCTVFYDEIYHNWTTTLLRGISLIPVFLLNKQFIMNIFLCLYAHLQIFL